MCAFLKVSLFAFVSLWKGIHGKTTFHSIGPPIWANTLICIESITKRTQSILSSNATSSGATQLILVVDWSAKRTAKFAVKLHYILAGSPWFLCVKISEKKYAHACLLSFVSANKYFQSGWVKELGRHFLSKINEHVCVVLLSDVNTIWAPSGL